MFGGSRAALASALSRTFVVKLLRHWLPVPANDTTGDSLVVLLVGSSRLTSKRRGEIE